MDFSDVLAGQRAVLSPDGTMLAAIDKYSVVVRDATSLEIVARLTCLDAVSQALWSPDSAFLLCAQHKRKLVQVFSLHDPDWSCKIDEGVAGLTHAMWSPDSRHILTTTEFKVRTTIWSLTNKSVGYIKFPKLAGGKGCVFSPDGRFLAVLERESFKDYVGVYFAETWELIKLFQLEAEDVVELQWSADSTYLLATESSLDYGVLVYTPDGRKVAKYAAYANKLGVKSACFSPSSTFVSVGSYDDKVRLLNSLTWEPVGELAHRPLIKAGSRCAAYREALQPGPTAREKAQQQAQAQARREHKAGDRAGAAGSSSSSSSAAAAAAAGTASPNVVPSHFVVDSPPVELKQVAAEPDQPDPAMGVGVMEWSSDDRYVATRSDSMPNSVWVWDTHSVSMPAGGGGVRCCSRALFPAHWTPDSSLPSPLSLSLSRHSSLAPLLPLPRSSR